MEEHLIVLQGDCALGGTTTRSYRLLNVQIVIQEVPLDNGHVSISVA